MTVSIVLADDHAVLRKVLRALLTREPDLQVIGEAADGDGALRLAQELRPDILLADLRMPGPDGIELARILRQSLPNIRVLILTMHDDMATLDEAMAAGAHGYVPKRVAQNELVDAVRIVAAGGIYHPPHLRVAHTPPSYSDGPPTIVSLTQHETDLVRELVCGRTKAQIAHRLRLSIEAVDIQYRELTTKLGLNGRAGLARYAQEQGIMQ